MKRWLLIPLSDSLTVGINRDTHLDCLIVTEGLADVRDIYDLHRLPGVVTGNFMSLDGKSMQANHVLENTTLGFNKELLVTVGYSSPFLGRGYMDSDLILREFGSKEDILLWYKGYGVIWNGAMFTALGIRKSDGTPYVYNAGSILVYGTKMSYNDALKLLL